MQRKLINVAATSPGRVIDPFLVEQAAAVAGGATDTLFSAFGLRGRLRRLRSQWQSGKAFKRAEKVRRHATAAMCQWASSQEQQCASITPPLAGAHVPAHTPRSGDCHARAHCRQLADYSDEGAIDAAEDLLMNVHDAFGKGNLASLRRASTEQFFTVRPHS